MIGAMKEVEKLISKVDFNELWDDFVKSRYAIYDDTNFYINDDRGLDLDLIKRDTFFVGNVDERFAGNTAISINDNFIAIVGKDTIENNRDNVKLASIIIHEMFHCFQYYKGEKRFPNELLAIDYPITYENIYYRMIERQYLFEACFEKCKEEKVELLSNYFTVRTKRENLIGLIINYEKAIESVEGTAVYVEYKALTQLTANNDVSILEDYIKGFTDIKEENLKIRLSSYHQGLLLGLIADELISDWKAKFDSSKLYISDFIKRQLKIEEADIHLGYDDVSEIEQCITNWNRKVDEVFDDFDKKDKLNSMKDSIQMAGFDPMNIVKRGKEIIHKNFIRIKTDDSELIIKGPVKTLIGKHLFDIKKMEW